MGIILHQALINAVIIEFGKRLAEFEESGDYNIEGEFEDIHYTLNVTVYVSYSTSPGDYYTPEFTDKSSSVIVNYIEFINSENEEKMISSTEEITDFFKPVFLQKKNLQK
jgi:hypothetical protein